MIPQYIDYLTKFDKIGYMIIKENLWKLVLELLNDKSEENILKLSIDAIVKISNIMDEDDRATLILTSIIGIANDDGDESQKIENKCLAVKLFNELSELFGKNLCENYIVPQLTEFSDDQHFKVRKSVINNLIKIANLVSPQIFNNKIMIIYTA
jgi:hypothetical protein